MVRRRNLKLEQMTRMHTSTSLALMGALAAAACGTSVEYTPPTPFAQFTEKVDASTFESFSFTAPAIECARFSEYPSFVRLRFGGQSEDEGAQLDIRVGPLSSAATTFDAANVPVATENDLRPLQCGEPCAWFAWAHGSLTATSHRDLDHCVLDASLEDVSLSGNFECRSMLSPTDGEVDIVGGSFLCELE